MREIKFRAFQKERKEMRYDVQQPRYDFGKILNDKEMYEVMQSTGLLDKLGKEIYEGDICQCGANNCIKGKIKYYEGKAQFVLEFYMNKAKQYCTAEMNRIKQDDESNTNFEIIGNVYENPELLEVK